MLCGVANAQPKFQFEEENFDFGEVVEGEIATHEFSFTNVGDQPLVISQVKASCGCTTPHWTREAIPPGGTGTIKAAYNSARRPGNFNKSITIWSNAETSVQRLVIRGSVVNRPPSAEEIAQSPKIVVAAAEFQFGKAEKGKPSLVTVEVTNEGATPLVFRQVNAACNCFSFDKTFDLQIAPGQTEAVSLIYTPTQLGNRLEVFTLRTNDLNTPNLIMKMQAEVVENLADEGVMGNSRRGF